MMKGYRAAVLYDDENEDKNLQYSCRLNNERKNSLWPYEDENDNGNRENEISREFLIFVLGII